MELRGSVIIETAVFILVTVWFVFFTDPVGESIDNFYELVKLVYLGIVVIAVFMYIIFCTIDCNRNPYSCAIKPQYNVIMLLLTLVKTPVLKLIKWLDKNFTIKINKYVE